MSETCRVMHVVESLDVGGMENGVVNIANLIDKERFTLFVCCLSHPGSLTARIRDNGVEVEVLHWRGGFSLSLFFKLARVFRACKVDVVHTHGWLTLLYASIASVLARVPWLINGEHGTFHLDNMRRRAAYRLLSLLVDRYVVVSHSLEDEVKKILRGLRPRVVSIPNGVDLRKFSPAGGGEVDAIRREVGIPPSACVIGSVGRLELVKNYEMLLHVFCRLSGDHPELHCVLVGDGSRMESLQTLARELGIAERVHFTGKTDKPHKMMCALDIFLSTSFSEGMSNTILEAMACAKPVVATEVGDSGKLIKGGENGFLVPSGDSRALEEALMPLIADRELRRRLGARSRELAEQGYDISKMIDVYQAVYLEATGKAGRSYGL